MTHNLITFLGKGKKEEGGYREANYLFESGRNYATPYFGLALCRELAAAGTPVDHLIVLGTASSIWDAILLDEMRDNTLWAELSEKVEQGTVGDALLELAAQDIAGGFSQLGLARRVSLRIIPFAKDECEQIAILQKMSDLIGHGEQVSMDISHGFRTLPMLGLVSALFLQRLKKVTIHGIYYGALEMANTHVPVVRLDGLLRITDWLTAISAFEASGDYGLFAPLVGNQAAGASLSQAGFLEKTSNIAHARKHLRQAVNLFPELKATDPIFALFSETLRGFARWTDEQSYALRQLSAAKNALAVNDFIRAASLAMEALISQQLPNGTDPNNYGARSTARDQLNARCSGQGAHTTEPIIRAYMELRDLRNAMSHGTPPTHNSFNQQSSLAERQRLASRLSELFAIIARHISG